MAYDIARDKHTAQDFSCGIGGPDDVGSFVFTESDQKRLYGKLDDIQKKANDKIDDVRYDVRRASSLVGAAVGGLAGAVAMLGLAHLWNAVKLGSRS
jgi:hypothetical protein